MSPLNEQQYVCEQCQKNYSSKRSLSDHMRRIHASSRSSHSCGHCMKAYRTERSLLDHMKKVHKPEDLSCESCSRKFESVEARDQHTSKRFLVCEWLYYSYSGCVKKFSSIKELRQHMREKHKCDVNENLVERTVEHSHKRGNIQRINSSSWHTLVDNVSTPSSQ